MEIEQRLSTPVSVKFNNKPLSEVIEVLGGYAQVPTYLDPQGLQSEGVSSSQLVTIDLRNDISLKSALKLILEQFRLTYVIKDEVLKITSQDVRRGELIQKIYPVGDLIIPIPNFIPNGREGINAALREGFCAQRLGGRRRRIWHAWAGIGGCQRARFQCEHGDQSELVRPNAESWHSDCRRQRAKRIELVANRGVRSRRTEGGRAGRFRFADHAHHQHHRRSHLGRRRRARHHPTV